MRKTSDQPMLLRIEDRPAVLAGQYVKSFDHDDGPTGYGEFTLDPREAMTFPTAREALEFWRKQSSTHPLRGDGQPNRPLTASTVSLMRLSDALKLSGE